MDAITEQSDVWETVPNPTMESVIDSEHAVANEVLLEQRNYSNF